MNELFVVVLVIFSIIYLYPLLLSSGAAFGTIFTSSLAPFFPVLPSIIMLRMLSARMTYTVRHCDHHSDFQVVDRGAYWRHPATTTYIDCHFRCSTPFFLFLFGTLAE
jgi:hypothetical protein